MSCRILFTCIRSFFVVVVVVLCLFVLFDCLFCCCCCCCCLFCLFVVVLFGRCVSGRQIDRNWTDEEKVKESMFENVHKISVTVTVSSSLPFTNLNHLEKKNRRKKRGRREKRKEEEKPPFYFTFEITDPKEKLPSALRFAQRLQKEPHNHKP